MSQWWKANSSFFEEERQNILDKYPSLTYIVQKNKVKLIGELYLSEINDSYSIEIEFPDNYPNKLPTVKEVDGDIKKDLDMHVSFDGSCCLCLPHLEKQYFPSGSNIIVFLENLVKPFFANQAYFKLTGKWITGEYSHGLKGIFEFYSDIFISDDIKIIKKLLYISVQAVPNYNKKCPCGNNKSIKKCHLSKIVQLKKYTDNKQIKDDLISFE